MLAIARNDLATSLIQKRFLSRALNDQPEKEIEDRNQDMRGRSCKRKPEKRDIVLTPVVVSLRKLSEGSYSPISTKPEETIDIEKKQCNGNMAKLGEINSPKDTTLINGDSQTNGTCCDDESVCDDKSICQDPGWQKDVSDVLTSLLKDGGTCASEWGGDIEDGIIELPDLERGEDHFIYSKSKNSNGRTTNFLLGSSKEKSRSLDNKFLPIKIRNLELAVEDSGSDATITEIADNVAELDSIIQPSNQESLPTKKENLSNNETKASSLDISESAAPESLEPEYSDKLKLHKVSPLSVYAEVKDGEIQSVSCKRFKRRRKRQSDEHISKIVGARRKKSLGSVVDGDLPTEDIVKDVVNDLIFRVFLKSDEIDLDAKWSPEDVFVGKLISSFCEAHQYDHRDFSDLSNVLDFERNILTEMDLNNGSTQRKGCKRKFSQDEDTSFKKKRRRKLKRGEVVKKFFTRSAARKLQYITAKNGDTVVVEDDNLEVSEPDDKEELEKADTEIEEVIESPEAKEVENIEILEIAKATALEEKETAVSEEKIEDPKPTQDIVQPTAEESITPNVKLTEEEPGSKVENKLISQEDKTENKKSEETDDRKVCTALKFRYKQRKIKCSREEPKKPSETDVPLDLRVKEGGDNSISSAKSKTPIQMVHPQVNTSLMPKKIWCARRNLDCFTSNETLPLVNGTSSTEVKENPPTSTPKVVIEPKRIQESEAESILRTLLLEASDAAAAEAVCDNKKSPVGSGVASPSVPRVPSAGDKENAKTTTDHKEALIRIKEVIRRSTPRLKSSPAPPPASPPKSKPFEIDGIVDMDKLQDPRLIKEEIRKLKSEIIHLEMIAEQKEKERVAIVCFKKCKEEILKQIENSQLSSLLQKAESCDSEPSKTHSAVQSKLSLQALYNFAKNKMLDTWKQSTIYQSNHRETCMVRPIVAHENRKSPLSTESLPSVEALVAKATENYGVTFDHLTEEKAQSLSRRTLEHNRRMAELQHSAYQCCADSSWTTGVYGYGPSPVLCNNSFHTSIGIPMSKSSTEQDTQQAQIKSCWKYSNIAGYGNKDRLDTKVTDEHAKAENNRDSKILYHPTASVPPASWTDRSYNKHINGTVTSKPSEVPSSSGLTPTVSAPSATYMGNNVGRYTGITLSQPYYPSPNYSLPVSYWSPNSYPSHQLPRRQQQLNESEVSSNVRAEKQRWMDRPCPTYHSSYVSPRGNSTSPC